MRTLISKEMRPQIIESEHVERIELVWRVEKLNQVEELVNVEKIRIPTL